jgi:FkbM family methyltransferase|tara:strand:+ start:1205 stop:1918 length:714 start_codon:yes stop_codon:yes gene_type:complete
MKLEQDEIKGIKFCHRKGFSDLKTFEEVIGRRTYLKRGMRILPGERWMDCGGNVGAFALLACSLGAEVVTYEPDPYSCEMIEKNLKLNGFRATVKQRALVPDDRDEVTLFIGNNNNVWRNSIVKKWNKMGIKVPCARFDDESKGFHGCKMDIEGSEMPILEATEALFEKLVYEWSFDIDPSLTRLWKVIDRQKKDYRIEAAWSSIHYHDKSYERWQPEWFPACTNVFCYEKNTDENS